MAASEEITPSQQSAPASKMGGLIQAALAPVAVIVYGGTSEEHLPPGLPARLLAFAIAIFLAAVAILAAHQCGRGA